MGQKVHPYGLRLGHIVGWHSSWYAKSNYVKYLHEDLAIRKYIDVEMKNAAISSVSIDRTADQVSVTAHTAKPGVAIGKKGAGIDKVREGLKKIVGGTLTFNVAEVKRPDADAKVMAENIASQLEKRIAFRRAMKKVMQSAFRAGVKGVRVRTAGRLGGAEMARREGYSEKKVPLHTLRADVDYQTAEAKTTYGIIGVKVWVYRGEIYR